MKAYRIIILLLVTMVMAGCEKAENKYSNFSAHFTYTPVNSIPTLYRACTSYGEFCSITLPIGDVNRFHFTSVHGYDVANRTAIQGYTGFILGLSGLIVGLPNIPELGQIEPTVVCYDLCCPNCYDESYISREMELREGGYTYCARCRRTYDLNNMGVVSQGDGGRSLFRYMVFYTGNTLAVNNN